MKKIMIGVVASILMVIAINTVNTASFVWFIHHPKVPKSLL